MRERCSDPGVENPTAPTRPTIECWFDFASIYSYLSVMRIERECEPSGIAVDWQPFLLGPIFRSLGWTSSPFIAQQAKGNWAWIDMERQCAKYGLPWQRPSIFPQVALLPPRVALAARHEPWVGAFCRRLMQMNFAEAVDTASVQATRRALTELGLPADTIIEAAQAEPAKLALRVQTERAAAKGIFGAPTFFVDERMYWGNDRLDDALASLISRA
jgi:2-hydroxychromene-2-carboxylate isomerase